MSNKLVNKNKTFLKQETAEVGPYATTEEISKSRVVKDIGYGITTPRTAYEEYYDKKCPFTGDITVRGRIITAEIVKMKAEKTIVVQKNYLHYVPKYKRFERRNTRLNVHLSPCFNGLVQVGDTVICGETRPLSKTKHFAVVGIEKKASDKNVKEFSL
ncbi:RS11 [Hepatospora eriocheir]|uniref:Small ribosomal subunit protein uS17 n=1 Tax=Hepatospora eriocheir TaxID=1081669 RepID=A0A1X0QHG0_9MICR|nr:RS11 [Hepatospora eriocheir]